MKENMDHLIKKEFSVESFSKSLENIQMEPQQEIAAIGYFLLRKRAESVGVKIKDFDISSIATWDEYHEHFWAKFRPGGNLDDSAAVYNHDLNQVTSARGGKDASLSKYTHEMAHFISSVQNLPNASTSENRMYKTGFCSTFKSRDLNEGDSARDSFRLLNEGMTELITHDICGDMTPEKLGLLYKEIFPKNAKENLEKSKAEHAQWLEKIKPLEKEMQEKELAEFSDFISSISDEEQREMYIKAHEGRMQTFQKLKEQREKAIIKKEALPFNGESNPLEDINEVAYEEMVDLVSLIIDGIGFKFSKEKDIPFENGRELAYKEMQKAYFQGDVLHLKILESVYGEGFLKKIAKLDYDTISIDEENRTAEWKEYEDVKNIVESVNESLRN